MCNTFLNFFLSGMTVFGYTIQVRTATIQVTFCSLVEQDETHSTPNTHSCSLKLPLCCFGKGEGRGRAGGGGGGVMEAGVHVLQKTKELSRAFLRMFQGH